MPPKTISIGLALLIMAWSQARAQTAIDPTTLGKAQSGDARAEYAVGDFYYDQNNTAHAADAFAWMQKAAAQKLPVAIGELGLFYEFGFGCHPEFDKGVALLEQADAAGDDTAGENLGVLYAGGHGDALPPDRRKAIDYLQRPAADHDIRGEFDLGFVLEQGASTADQELGLVYLQEAAKAGDFQAMAELGNIYNSGNAAVKPDRSKAEPYFRMAIASGDPSIMTALAVDLVRDGDPDGGPKDREAAPLLAKAAEAGNPDAENDFGYILQYGRGVPEDDADAVKWDKAAAAQGNMPATRRLGYLYLTGTGTSADAATAKSLFQTAASHGDIIAMRLLGQMLLAGSDGDRQQAASLFKQAAIGGDPRGEADYGYVLEHGVGIQGDVSTAIAWFKRAGAQNDVYAQRSLGAIYLTGDGPAAADPVTAAAWFAKAAAGGDAYAQNQLGNLYYSGHGMAKDMAKAGQLYQQSAAQRFAPGETKLAQCYLAGDCAARDPAKAVPLVQDAAAQDDGAAENIYGWMLGLGVGTVQDFRQALYWNQRAAAHHMAGAIRRVGYFTEYGMGTTPDVAAADRFYTIAAGQGDATAMRLLGEDLMRSGTQDRVSIGWLAQAAQAGDAVAQVDYGYMLENGRGTNADLQDAILWYQRAAAQQQVNGEKNLGLLYAEGRGLPKDDAKAVYWDTRAAAQGDAQALVNLGLYYYNGQAVPKNMSYAGRLFAAAAAKNYPNGQANYGLCQIMGDCAPKDRAAGFALAATAAAHGDSVAQGVLGFYYLGIYGGQANKPYALLWFRIASANGNQDAARELQRWHLTQPAQNAEIIRFTTTVTGDLVPVSSGSACASRGGYGDDTYCTKNGEQIDPLTGDILSQNESGYFDDNEINDDDQVQGEPGSTDSEYYAPAEDSGDVGGGGYVDDGGGDSGGDSGGDGGTD